MSTSSASETMSSTSTGTNLGPLTTTFTPPSTCTYIFSAPNIYYTDYLAQTCTAGAASDAQLCWPARTTDVPNTAGALNGWGYYSPGLICPSGFQMACSATAAGTTVTGDFSFQFALSAGETAIGCCPSSYSCAIDVESHQSCVKEATTMTTYVAATCLSGGNSYATFTTSASSVQVWGPMFELVYQSGDYSSFIATTATETGSSSAGSPSSSPSEATTGLALGAKIGIGIGVPVAVIGILLTLIFFWRRQRKVRSQRSFAASGNPVSVGKPREHESNGESELSDRVAIMEETSELDGRAYSDRPLVRHQIASELPTTSDI